MTAAPSPVNIVDRMLDAFAGCLTPDVLAAVASQQFDADVTNRIDELAAKANEGRLTPEELAEYDESIALGHYFTILKLKARLRLQTAA